MFVFILSFTGSVCSKAITLLLGGERQIHAPSTFAVRRTSCDTRQRARFSTEGSFLCFATSIINKVPWFFTAVHWFTAY